MQHEERDQKRRQASEQTCMASRWEGAGHPGLTDFCFRRTPTSQRCAFIFSYQRLLVLSLDPPLPVWMFSNQVHGISTLEEPRPVLIVGHIFQFAYFYLCPTTVNRAPFSFSKRFLFE